MLIVSPHLSAFYIYIKSTTTKCAGCFEHGDEPSGSMKNGKFLDCLSDS